MTLPSARGLYDPSFEHDACGVGFVAHLRGQRSHDIVERGVGILLNLEHRGATGCDPQSGDGAGILLQVPHELLAAEMSSRVELPLPGKYGVGCVFLPRDASSRARCQQILEDKILGTGQRLLGWREVPVDEACLGPIARQSAPLILQVLVGSTTEDEASFERKLFVIRKWAERTIRESDIPGREAFYIPSLSCRTLVYKGLLLAHQLAKFYRDLEDSRLVSALSMVHQRFSTNTFPTWQLAQPFRLLSHNGEINTVRGNAQWMRAREQLFDGRVFGEDVRHILPTITPGGSDSAQLDNVAELLLHAGRSLPHVLMMLVPEAWQNDPSMPAYQRDFYAYHACLVEPWDGPAALTFTDGSQIGALLDRNGLRPARWMETRDGLVVLASETGVMDVPPDQIARKGRLEPGRMFLVDLKGGRIVEDAELKRAIAHQKPYGKWLRDNAIHLDEIDDVVPEAAPADPSGLLVRQRVFGYTTEDLALLLQPMAEKGEEPVGSMGTDTPLAVLSDRPQLLFSYFKQQFAQVTNPAIDPIREALVMSLRNFVGGEDNLLFELPDHAQMLELRSPVLTNEELSILRGTHQIHFRRPATLPMVYPVAEGGRGLKAALDELCRQASLAVLNNHGVIVLSDKSATAHMAPVPSLLGLGAVHCHLMRNGTRMRVGILVETGEAREVHHFCLLFGFGAGAVNPYVALDSVAAMARKNVLDGVTDGAVAQKNLVKAINKGVLKVMSKMGISTLQSYQGSQIFEALGLGPDVIERYFTGTTSRLGGLDLEAIAEECQRRNEAAFPRRRAPPPGLDPGGEYQFRAESERHLWGPRVVSSLQRAVREADDKSYREYSDLVNQQSRGPITLRGLWNLLPAEAPIPLSDVEPATEIVRRFATGAMSFGSISAEAHENLAIAMNRIGGRSNTGEGGEREERFVRLPNGDSKRSHIKQVASGRFGVTAHYLVNADELQIKIAQGAKPGEGGQLPGHKVDAVIAQTRHSTPGVTLISPPPHHDIYSIEDLAQLIFDLKMVNPKARVSVKLVAEAGVGTIAAGVAKARADVILISGFDGGTGASPLTSIKHAGVPWELGLAETHQVLVKNDLRSRVVVQTDGQMRTGRDVVIAALLGAEEFGFATAPLVASGCIMMRKCHLNTCPVGVATQDPELRKKFAGEPEHVIRFMFYVAEEARELMSQLGFRTIQEIIGRVDRIRPRDSSDHFKAKTLDFGALLMPAERGTGAGVCKSLEQEHGLERSLDHELLPQVRAAIEDKEPTRLALPIKNVHRTVGAMLAGEIARRHGRDGLPDGTLCLDFEGSAGQSFGAFAVRGMHLHLEGDANDYVGKGLSGGTLSVRPPRGVTFRSDESVLVGNVALYGATSGKAFISGVAGERFAVRNSGAIAVVEGVGDHGCEYMTGGRVVVIGRTGRNFAAGMSGGFAYVLDEDGRFEERCNKELVVVEALGPDDAAFVAELLDEHRRATGSAKAAELVLRWEETRPRLLKVVPLEYRRVLAELDERRNVASSAEPTDEEPLPMPRGSRHATEAE